MSLIQHGIRVGLLMAGATFLFTWLNYHSEVTFADGLRYIKQAERIEKGAWSEGLVRSVDHPVHPIAIATVHRIFGGEGPVSWQRAAQVVAIASCVLLVIPLYMLGLEMFGPTAAWLGTLLFIANPILAFVVINVLSESTFLFFWTMGLWAALRFLREGKFLWLPLTIAFGAVAYLARPEGLLLPLTLVVTLLLLPLHWSTRIHWPRWWAAVGFMVIGPLLLVGPYIASKGGLGTKPSIARLIGTTPASAPQALERERPLSADQTVLETYRQSTRRMWKVVRTSVSTPLLAAAVLGIFAVRPWSSRAQVWLFLTIMLAASAVGLIRLHATGGYCTVRHAMIPCLLLTMAAANGLGWLMQSVVIPGKWFGRGEERFKLGPAVWAVVLAALVVTPHVKAMTPFGGSFAAYRDAGDWLAQETADKPGKVLDLTNWALYFSDKPGLQFADIHDARWDPNTRWVVVRGAHLRGRWNYIPLVKELIGNREPIMVIPPHAAPKQIQLRIYDRSMPNPEAVAVKPAPPTRAGGPSEPLKR